VEREGFQQVEASSITAEELQEAPVYGMDDREIASVNDVQLDENGQIQYFVMDVGGFLGIGARNVAVGFDEATIVRDEAGEHPDLRRSDAGAA
jgi:sporulation protein YlmC with PRC-barrel domain